ncbi:aminoglycoside phosphotransferase family protein [Actinoalloteichus hymeniacidonis]|uniref:Aminoglycoside/hydroxyurea antibiotic resistance kinase n=1 Tax=Actinoalloteichus hymeniacidonis TaxID=340345 RepID=A0AAC9HSF2_9PSEU|nr:aminoglycoside phosphotransferase family protein [Actinoalloteichus hymeniacidonis]AOS64131.1 Aminoglycoside/hydroxyurea antibiotic resistance kinase [Actinoalloteichus hymeniacidonis]
MEDVATRLTDRFGPQAASWLAEVPTVAAQLASRWGLTLGEMFESGASSVVLRCRWRDGIPAVLKLTPDRALLAKQVEMLRVFEASGRVPAVLATDAEVGAMVLEEILPGTEATDLPAVDLPERWAELLGDLHAVPVPADWPWDLRGRFAESFERVGKRLDDPKVGARIDAATWQRAIRRCETLLNTQTAPVLLHGDLHLGNVLDGGPSRGLVAIDPKACVGDPCFDAVDYVVEGAGQEGIEARCLRVATACGLDADRLLEWSRVVAPMFAVSHLAYGGPEPVLDELLTLIR